MRTDVAAKNAISVALRARLLPAPMPATSGVAAGGALLIPYEEFIFECQPVSSSGASAFATVYDAFFRGEPAAVKVLALLPGVDLRVVEHELWVEASVQWRLRQTALVPLLGVPVRIDRATTDGPPTGSRLSCLVSRGRAQSVGCNRTRPGDACA
jgi:hypothetical protein